MTRECVIGIALAARACGREFVHTASRYRSKISISRAGKTVEGRASWGSCCCAAAAAAPW